MNAHKITFRTYNVRPLHERYDGLKWFEFSLFQLKIRSIARLYPNLEAGSYFVHVP